MQSAINHKKPTEQLTTIPRGFIRRKRLVEKYGDFQITVARRIGVTGAAVNKVWQGATTSPRITEAILEELNKRIAEAQLQKSA